MLRMAQLPRAVFGCGALVLLLTGCAAAGGAEPTRYRLTGSGAYWDRRGDDRVLEDLLSRYPTYFEVVLDPGRSDEPDLRKVKSDLEHAPVDRRNYDALNAVAIGYYELNYRGERMRRSGDVGFMTAGFRAAHLVAVPWRAYGEIDDPALRNAILDFFEDAASGEKPGTRATAGRLARIVASLVRKEEDPERAARIERVAASLRETGEAQLE